MVNDTVALIAVQYWSLAELETAENRFRGRFLGGRASCVRWGRDLLKFASDCMTVNDVFGLYDA